MRRLDFEQAILDMVFDAGYEHLSPAIVAYHLKIPIKAAEQYLDALTRDAILDMEVNDAGHVTYRLPDSARPPAATLERTRRFRATHGEGGAPFMPPAAVVLQPPSPPPAPAYFPPAPPSPSPSP